MNKTLATAVLIIIEAGIELPAERIFVRRGERLVAPIKTGRE